MVILVTGGAGFIGSHVVDQLIAEGHEVRILDLLHPSVHPVTPSYLRRDVDLRVIDIRDEAAVETAVRGVDAVSHQASKVGLGVDIGDILDYVSHNDLGTATLLRALHRTRFRGRFVLASSMVVYGEGAYRCDRCERQIRPEPRSSADLADGRFDPRCPRCGGDLQPQEVGEDAPSDPRNVYAATKLHQEHLVGAFARETGIPVAYLRYHNVYGPRIPLDTPYAGVASIFRSALSSGRAPIVFEDGRQRRNFVHVHDVARANVLALTSDAEGAFNIASMEAHTVGEMAEAMVAAFGPGAPTPVVSGAYRPGDVRHVFAAPHKAREVFGFASSITFAQGIGMFAALDGADQLSGPRGTVVVRGGGSA